MSSLFGYNCESDDLWTILGVTALAVGGGYLIYDKWFSSGEKKPIESPKSSGEKKPSELSQQELIKMVDFIMICSQDPKYESDGTAVVCQYTEGITGGWPKSFHDSMQIMEVRHMVTERLETSGLKITTKWRCWWNELEQEKKDHVTYYLEWLE